MAGPEFLTNRSWSLRRFLVSVNYWFNGLLPALSVYQKAAVLSAVACTVATTNLQPEPDAEPKSAVSAETFRR
jgi:hypothetical protein